MPRTSKPLGPKRCERTQRTLPPHQWPRKLRRKPQLLPPDPAALAIVVRQDQMVAQELMQKMEPMEDPANQVTEVHQHQQEQHQPQQQANNAHAKVQPVIQAQQVPKVALDRPVMVAHQELMPLVEELVPLVPLVLLALVVTLDHRDPLAHPVKSLVVSQDLQDHPAPTEKQADLVHLVTLAVQAKMEDLADQELRVMQELQVAMGKQARPVPLERQGTLADQAVASIAHLLVWHLVTKLIRLDNART